MISTPPDSPHPENKTDPVILQQHIDAVETRFLLYIPDDLVYFEDHFPGYPMLPGVVQIQWVTNLAKRLPLPDAFLENFSTITKLKFMRLIAPEVQLTLQLIISPSDKSLSFRYFDDAGDYSSGHLGFR